LEPVVASCARARLDALGLLLTLAGCLLPAAALADEVAYDSTRDAVLLQLTESYGELAGQSSYVLHGDGRLVTQHPAGRRAPSGLRATLPAARVRALLERIASSGVAEFDAEDVKARKRVADAAQGRSRQLFAVSDASSLEIRFSFEVVDTDGDARAIERVLRWRGLRHDARRYPGIESLQRLESLRREIIGLSAESAGPGAP
jgi:hypothetical protein